MTQAETSRGRGRPKGFDEQTIVDRVRSDEDLWKLRRALSANDEPAAFADGAVRYIEAKVAGDPTGGGVSRMTEYRYRQAFARLPEIPLPPAPKRRRTAARQRGSAELVLVGAAAGAGAVALSALAGPQGLNFALSLISNVISDTSRSPIMPRTVAPAAELELAA